MGIIDYLLGLSPEFVSLKRKVSQIMNDLTVLQQEIAALKATSTEVIATLSGLVDRIMALEGSENQQVQIDALVAEAKNIRESLATAEDSADDHLGTVGPV